MSKITLVVQREYLSRVKKKSFIVMTILGPILMAALFVLPIWIVASGGGEEMKKIMIIDKTQSYENTFTDTESMTFDYAPGISLDSAREMDYHAVVLIPENFDGKNIQVYSQQHLSLNTKISIDSQIEQEVQRRKLREGGYSEDLLKEVTPDTEIETIQWTEEGEEKQSSTELSMAVGFIAAFLIYMFIFMYGVQVMRGVIEEKTNRIVEIIISSVKPFQLMMGKIIGIALVALTQFALWIVLTLLLLTLAQSAFLPDQELLSQGTYQQMEMQAEGINSNEMLGEAILFMANFNFLEFISVFIFFFFGGYLLYSSLFAAVGSAVDNETDTQQFMLPITIPLILAFLMAQAIIENPAGPIAQWFSIIPFTSPIIMVIRVAFQSYETWELLLSMALLVLTFIGTTWLAGKIYRTGILMYGKKITYKELWKWIRYKN